MRINLTLNVKAIGTALLMAAAIALTSHAAFARDVEYNDQEISINVTPGEPTQVRFPDAVQGGVKRKVSALSLQHNDSDLVIFASEGLTEGGEAIIVRLKDNRTFAVRVMRATDANPRDDVVKITDARSNVISDASEEPQYRERNFEYAPSSQVSGLMREMMLVAEFGKDKIPGYRVTEQYKGEPVLNDGTMVATIDKIFMGPNLWGYVLDTQNLLDTTQRLNPAAFRLDGTRAISAQTWELSPRPMDVEQQIASKDRSKIYIVTRAHKAN